MSLRKTFRQIFGKPVLPLVRRKVAGTGFWYVDIARTSSTSLKTELDARFGWPYGKDRRIDFIGEATKKSLATRFAGGRIFRLPDHLTALEMRKLPGHELWQRRFTFSVIRNPWERYVSLYIFHCGMPLSPSQMRAPFKSVLFAKYRSRAQSWLPANKLLCDEENNLLVDFVARYENRREDLAHVGERIGFPELGESLKISTSASRSHFREYYDDELRDKVAEISRWEIERFNYSFDG